MRGPLFALWISLVLGSLAHADYVTYTCDNGFVIDSNSPENALLTWTDQTRPLEVERSNDPDRFSVSMPPQAHRDVADRKDKITVFFNGQPVQCLKNPKIPDGLSIDLTSASAATSIVPFGHGGESVLQPVSSVVGQLDPHLASDFASNGSSYLCTPAALAQGLLFLRSFGSPHFPNLKLNDGQLSGSSVDPNRLVLKLASLCGTVPSGGTSTVGFTGCIAGIFRNSGYTNGQLKLISIQGREDLPGLDPSVSLETRWPTPDDISKYVRRGYAVGMVINSGDYDLATQTFRPDNGHFVTIAGYEKDPTWSTQRMSLKIVDPMHLTYPGSRQSPVKSVTMVRTTVPYPGAYVLYGDWFNLRGQTAMVMEVFAYRPN